MLPMLHKPSTALSRIFEDSFFDNDFFSIFNNQNSVGAVNVIEDEKNYTIEVNVAGMNKDDVVLTLEDGYLNIKGKTETKSENKSKNYSRREFSSSSFERNFKIPEDVASEQITAENVNGVLKIQLNRKKLPEKEKSKQIEIK